MVKNRFIGKKHGEVLLTVFFFFLCILLQNPSHCQQKEWQVSVQSGFMRLQGKITDPQEVVGSSMAMMPVLGAQLQLGQHQFGYRTMNYRNGSYWKKNPFESVQWAIGPVNTHFLGYGYSITLYNKQKKRREKTLEFIPILDISYWPDYLNSRGYGHVTGSGIDLWTQNTDGDTIYISHYTDHILSPVGLNLGMKFSYTFTLVRNLSFQIQAFYSQGLWAVLKSEISYMDFYHNISGNATNRVRGSHGGATVGLCYKFRGKKEAGNEVAPLKIN